MYYLVIMLVSSVDLEGKNEKVQKNNYSGILA